MNNLALRFAWGLFEALSSEKGCCLNAWECFRFLTCSLNRLIDLRLYNLALSAERVCFLNLIQFIHSKQERQLSWLFKPGCFFCFGHTKSQSKKITGLWGKFICCTMPCCHDIWYVKDQEYAYIRELQNPKFVQCQFSMLMLAVVCILKENTFFSNLSSWGMMRLRTAPETTGWDSSYPCSLVRLRRKLDLG